MGQSRPLFLFIFVFSTRYNLNSNLNWKKHRWCAWESNPGRQDGRRKQIHWATAAPRETTFFMFRLIHQLLPSWSTCFFAVTLACQNNILHIFKEWTTCGLLVKMYFCLMEIKVLHLYLAGWQDLQLGLMHFCEKYFTDRARSLDGWIVFHDSINKISVANLINILRS